MKENRNTSAEYTKIKKAIPTNWLDILMGNVFLDTPNLLINDKQLCLDNRKIQLNGREIHFLKLKQKYIYHAFLYPAQVPNCVEKWNLFLNLQLACKDIFMSLMETKSLCDKKFLIFSLKLYIEPYFVKPV